MLAYLVQMIAFVALLVVRHRWPHHSRHSWSSLCPFVLEKVCHLSSLRMKTPLNLPAPVDPSMFDLAPYLACGEYAVLAPPRIFLPRIVLCIVYTFVGLYSTVASFEYLCDISTER